MTQFAAAAAAQPAGIPQYAQSLMHSPVGSIKRRFPTYWSDGEGGIDFSAPPGTPVIAPADGVVAGAGYFCLASRQFFLSSWGCSGGVLTTRVTNQDGSQTDLYYQHIVLNSNIRPCNKGIASCGGQVVKKGDVVGYIANFGMLEMGVNVGNSPNATPYPHGWGGIWGADPAPGPHVDPEMYLRALFSGSNTTGTIAGTGVGFGTANTSLGGILDFSSFFSFLKPLFDWINNPIRVIKLLAGLTLIGIALVMLMAPSYEQAFKKAFNTATKLAEAA